MAPLRDAKEDTAAIHFELVCRSAHDALLVSFRALLPLCASLPRSGGQVLVTDLNCSESREGDGCGLIPASSWAEARARTVGGGRAQVGADASRILAGRDAEDAGGLFLRRGADAGIRPVFRCHPPSPPDAPDGQHVGVFTGGISLFIGLIGTMPPPRFERDGHVAAAARARDLLAQFEETPRPASQAASRAASHNQLYQLSRSIQKKKAPEGDDARGLSHFSTHSASNFFVGRVGTRRPLARCKRPKLDPEVCDD
jgi:hypothetical protein